MNTHTSPNPQTNYLDDLTKIEHEIIEKSAGGEFLYRGERECNKKVSSTLYRHSLDKSDSPRFDIIDYQNAKLAEVRNYTHEHRKQAFELLTELQHYGSKTNLIDFTTDFHIALYFACDGSYDEDGRIILLKRSEETRDKYNIEKPQMPQNRVIGQKSIFAQPPQGYIDAEDISVVCVPKRLKQWILIHLQKFQDISTQSIYNDLHGYIRHETLSSSSEAIVPLVLADNAKELAEKNSSAEDRKDLLEQAISGYTEAIQYSFYDAMTYVKQAQCYVQTCEYDLAVETFSKAIFLRPDYVDAYLQRADTYQKISAVDFAIADYSKFRDLVPSSNDARYYGHVISRLDGSYENAIKGWREAIELKPEFAADAYPDFYADAYFWCGTNWMLLHEWCKAKSEFQAAKGEGMDVPSEFCNYFKSVKDFEASYRVTVPDDITEILEP